MVAGEHEDQLLGDELEQAEPVALDPLGDREEGEFELVDPEHLGQLLAGLLADGELDRRMALVEDGQNHRDVDRPHGVHDADRHPSGLDAAQPLHLVVGGVDLGQDPPGAVDEAVTGLGHRHPPRRPLHQGQADLVLEPADLLGECRLGDVLAGGGPGEM